MSITISCPCGKLLKVPDELSGKKGKCPGCGEVLDIPAVSPAAPLLEAAEDRKSPTTFIHPAAHPAGDPGGEPAVPPGWAPPPAPPAWAYTAAPVTSGMAIAGLVSSFLCGPVGIVLGIISMVRVKGSAGRQTGFGMALAGTIIGALWTVAAVFIGIVAWMMWGVVVEASHAVVGLDRIVQAEEAYFKENQAYWTRNVAELAGLSADFADADGSGEHPRPRRGYLFVAMETDDTGEALASDAGTHASSYAFCAYPSDPGAFSVTLIVSKRGQVLMGLTRGRPQRRWPDPSDIGRGRGWQIFDFDHRALSD